VILMCCFTGVLLLTLFPVAPNLLFLTPLLDMLHGAGVPEAYSYSQLEVTLNVIMFLPLGFLLAGLMPTLRLWWVAALASAAVSFMIELFQAVLLAGRSATVIDFVANSVGGLLGAFVAAVWFRVRGPVGTVADHHRP
jgi:glycopeptide antibiotics resistance protein